MVGSYADVRETERSSPMSGGKVYAGAESRIAPRSDESYNNLRFSPRQDETQGYSDFARMGALNPNRTPDSRMYLDFSGVGCKPSHGVEFYGERSSIPRGMSYDTPQSSKSHTIEAKVEGPSR